MDTVDYSFGHWLQRRRQALHLTQQQLGTLASCSAAMIRKIEADERRPSPDVLRLLAAALQIPDAEHTAFQQFARGQVYDVPEVPLPPVRSAGPASVPAPPVPSTDEP